MDGIVNHRGVEFGYELISAIPYANWLQRQGKLLATISNKDTECLYYFSPDHREDLTERHYKYVRSARLENLIPNINVHQTQLDWSKWSPPPYKEHYKNDEFDFDMVVCNKYNMEWRRPPVNFIDTPTLDKIFSLHRDKKILYSHMTTEMGMDDTVESLSLGEFDMVASHKNVTTIQDVIGRVENKYSFNELQCRVYANCDNFITVQGGTSIFASYFGGRNIIFAAKGNELKVGSYKWYHRFSGSEIVVVNKMEDILNETV